MVCQRLPLSASFFVTTSTRIKIKYGQSEDDIIREHVDSYHLAFIARIKSAAVKDVVRQNMFIDSA